MTNATRRDWSTFALAAAALVLAGTVAGVLTAAIGSIEPVTLSDPETGGFTVLPEQGTWWTRFLRAAPSEFPVVVALLLAGVARPSGFRVRWLRALVAAAAASSVLPVVDWFWNGRRWSSADLKQGLVPFMTAIACLGLAVLVPRGLASAAVVRQESEARHLNDVHEQEQP